MSRSLTAPNSFSIQWDRTRIICFSILWLLALAAFPMHNLTEKPAWDVHIYMQAIESVRAGHDPYADAIARQDAFHQAQERGVVGPVPFSYVYAPMTIPFLWMVANLPLWISYTVYWTLYFAGAAAQIVAGFRCASDRERPVFLFFLPAAVFFPGMLASDIVWSGNIAFLLYGAVLAAALIGWSRNSWTWFYVVTVVASCFKMPLLTLLAIPVLSARKQWVPAGAAAFSGLVLFFSQLLLMPTLFRHYLQAVELQFSYNRDFGTSLAGLFGGFLFDRKLPYSPATYIVYLAYVVPVCVVLFRLSRHFLAQRFTLIQWIPTMLVGVVLLNPRILEYDEIMLAIPLALILWRFFRTLTTQRLAIVLSSATFLVVNIIAYRNWTIWKLTEGPLLVACFIAGCWTLHHCATATAPASPSTTSKISSDRSFLNLQTSMLSGQSSNRNISGQRKTARDKTPMLP